MDLYKELSWFFEELKRYKELLEKPEAEMPERKLSFLSKDLQFDFPSLKNTKKN